MQLPEDVSPRVAASEIRSKVTGSKHGRTCSVRPIENSTSVRGATVGEGCWEIPCRGKIDRFCRPGWKMGLLKDIKTETGRG